MEIVWQSGIKALDLFAPIAHGALVRVEGRPGVGRNVFLAELAHNASSDPDVAVLWVSWERERWSGSELDLLVSESALRGRVHLLRHAHDADAHAGHALAERALGFADGLLAGGGAKHLHLVFFEEPGRRAGIEALFPALRAQRSITTFVVSSWPNGDDAVLAPPFDTLLAFAPGLAQAMCFPALDPARSRSRPIPGSPVARLRTPRGPCCSKTATARDAYALTSRSRSSWLNRTQAAPASASHARTCSPMSRRSWQVPRTR